MNTQVTRVATFALVLLVALIVGTTYWQVWAASGLAEKQDNAIQRVAQFTIKRGEIRGPGGKLVYADNVKEKIKGETFYFRKYPNRGLLAQTLGYSTQQRSRTGLEQSLNDYLTGANTNLNTVIRTSLDRLKGVTITGNNVFVTVDYRAQRVAQNALGTQCGAVVVLEPSTGKVLALASSPTFDLNLAEGHFDAIKRIRANCHPASPLVNRGTASLFPPGSTFKVITAAAALDTGKYTPESRFYDPGYCIEYGKQVKNAGDPESPEQFGTLTLFQGLEHSVNSVFCKIGISLGAKTLLDYSKRFGFYSLPPLETPTNERAASGLYDKGRLFFPERDSQVDPGRLAFGQERMIVTPIQMAMVAAGVANKGVVMRPYVVDRIEQPNGSLVTRTSPSMLGRAIKPQTAADLTSMMQAVVTGGTGQS
ncbi:MAG: penicillin-binding protein 2, partial [Actinobacteria bacterium]|nr:penicillin-binding protein 2 [Actinomycetota bacterium]